MKLAKSLLLGSAAAIAATAGAQAADLPYRKAAPVEYVRVCDWTGVGYFYIPGTDTCLNISGFIRAEYAFINNSRTFIPAGTGAGSGGTVIPGRLRDSSGFFVRGRLSADARTQTAYGTLRTYVRYQINRTDGNYAGGGGSLVSSGTNSATLDKGFIQFAGITAGRVQSFFDFYADNYNYEGIANSDENANVFAYTYNAAGGFSATLALEDHNERNDGIGNIGGGRFATPSTVAYGGETIPDIIGQLNVTQAWGQAQLSAAYHQVNTVAGAGLAHKDDDGFAIQGGVQFKLPMLAAGDDLWIQGAYQEGAYLYQDSAGNMNSGFNNLAVGGFQHLDHDAVAIGVPGTNSYTLEKSRGFSVMAAINHYFTPNFHDILFGSYEESSYGRAKNIDWTNGGIGDAREYRVGNQFLWDPVKNLEIGLEVWYAHIDQTLAHAPGVAATPIPTGVQKNPDSFQARLRMERDF
jgi:hypothetical protein